jgi:hypothetical protein
MSLIRLVFAEEVMMKLVCGVGINDADYIVQVWETIGYIDGKQKRKCTWKCPFYTTWKSMLTRCHSEKYKATYPTYKDVTVCVEWRRFSVFKAWMETQAWKGNQLDKDLLVEGNKVYSPDACVFVSSLVNKFLIDSRATRGGYIIGVCRHKGVGKFQTHCSNPFTKKGEYLGLFTSEQEAHEKWLEKKLEHAYTLAALQTDERVAKALVERYTNYEGEK